MLHPLELSGLRPDLDDSQLLPDQCAGFGQNDSSTKMIRSRSIPLISARLRNWLQFLMDAISGVVISTITSDVDKSGLNHIRKIG